MQHTIMPPISQIPLPNLLPAILLPLLQPHVHRIVISRVRRAPVQVLALARDARVVHLVLVGDLMGVGGGVVGEVVVPDYVGTALAGAGGVVDVDGGVFVGAGGNVVLLDVGGGGFLGVGVFVELLFEGVEQVRHGWLYVLGILWSGLIDMGVWNKG